MKRITTLLILAFIIANVPFHSGDAQGANRPPTANAGGDQTGPAGGKFMFNGSNSTDPDNDILEYYWDFDASDGIQVDASGVKVNHTFLEPGEFTVTLTVYDGQAQDTDTAAVTVLDNTVNHRPVAIIDEPRDRAFLNMTGGTFFDGRSSHDPDWEPITWLWDMGDNNHTFTVSHFYFKMPHAGVFTIVLKVSDGELEDSVAITVFVYPANPGIPIPDPSQLTQERPTIKDSGPYSGPERMGTWLSAFSSDADGTTSTLYWDIDMSDGVNLYNPDAMNGTVIWPYNATGTYTITIIAETHIAIGVNPNVGKLYNYTQTTANITEHCKPIIKINENVFIDRAKDATKVQTTLNPIAAVCQPSNDGELILYEWDFDGDGKWDWSSPNSGAVTHNYEVNSTSKGETHYNATLRVIQRNTGYVQTNMPGTPKGVTQFKYNVTANKTVNITISAPPNELPTCSILDPSSLSDPGGFVGEPMRFRAEGSDPDGSITRYVWDFGDGMSMIGKEVDHTYDNAFEGGVTVQLVCYDDRNGTGEDETQAIIRQNGLPVAVIAGPSQANVGETLTFDGTESTDPDGDPLTYIWDFDDSDGIGVDSTEARPTHTYEKGGSYILTLKVKDAHKGESEAATAVINVVQSYGFSTEVSPAKGKGKPGDMVVFHVLLKNTGNGDDTFTLDASGSRASWAIMSVSQVDIDTDKTADIMVSVRIPDKESAATHQIGIDIMSKGDARVKDTVDLSLQVLEVYGIDLVASVSTLNIKAGESSALTVTITNTGNAEDTVKLEASGDGSDWFKFASTSSKVGKGAKGEVKITITVPKETEGGDYAVTIKGTSGGGGMTDTVPVSISVTAANKGNKVPGFEGGLVALAILSVTLLAALARKGRR